MALVAQQDRLALWFWQHVTIAKVRAADRLTLADHFLNLQAARCMCCSSG
jgi:hypothetical protein